MSYHQIEIEITQHFTLHIYVWCKFKYSTKSGLNFALCSKLLYIYLGVNPTKLDTKLPPNYVNFVNNFFAVEPHVWRGLG